MGVCKRLTRAAASVLFLQAKGDDEGEAVTYSTVNPPAVDPSSLYASIM